MGGHKSVGVVCMITLRTEPEPTHTLNNADWAWEFLRINPKYRRDYRLSRARLLRIATHKSGMYFLRIRRRCPYANKWGLVYMCDPDLSQKRVSIAWHPDETGAVSVETRIFKKQGNAPDLDLPTRQYNGGFVIIEPDHQILYFRIGLRTASLKITGVSILLHSVNIRFLIEGVEHIQTAFPILEVIQAAVIGRKKLHEKPIPGTTQLRRSKYLIAARKASEGGFLKEIATVIYGEKHTQKEWNNPDSRSFKDEIVRAKRKGISLMNGGYRKLLF